MPATQRAAEAAVQVIEHWGVKHIYGIPGGSINSLMDGLLAEQDRIRYVQVRHEEVGAMAASMHAKFTGHVGVCFGSAGPGGTHLLNGLYDAKEDHVPVLAIIGQFGTAGMNMDTFQEINEDPIYSDVAAYHRVVMTAQQLPHVIDEGIRQAYANQGVAVVQIPVDLGAVEIPADGWFDSSSCFQRPPALIPDPEQVKQAAELLLQARRPLVFAGIGTRGAGPELMELSQKLKAPLMTSALNYNVVDSSYEGFLGSPVRVGRKPANEAVANADVVLMLGTNQPFIEVTSMFQNTKTVIQVDNDPAKLGKRQRTALAILGDAKAFLVQLNQSLGSVDSTPWWRANLKNIANWNAYCARLEAVAAGPLTAYQVLGKISQVASDSALFTVDVGDVTTNAVRHLHLTPGQDWRTSGLFATMGIAIPGSIAAKLDAPERQVWSLSGDGAATMVMQDWATQVQERLPIVNVVFANEQFGFIRDEQEVTNSGYYGVQFSAIDFAKVAEGLGAKGFTLRTPSDLDPVFAAALEAAAVGSPVVIDAKVSGESPIPVEALLLDPAKYSAAQISAFTERYRAQELLPFATFLAEEGLQEAGLSVESGGF
ncbi:MAG: pyruvate oxidase [Micrococcales bacterium]|nr:pyruvate oxidase [Micrococcales bacterium]